MYFATEGDIYGCAVIRLYGFTVIRKYVKPIIFSSAKPYNHKKKTVLRRYVKPIAIFRKTVKSQNRITAKLHQTLYFIFCNS